METVAGAVELPSERKGRGAFFTPSELCDYVVRWAIRSPDDLVLEPSCGEAAFLVSAGRKLLALNGSEARTSEQLCGVELHEASAAAAVHRLRSDGLDARVAVGDFFNLKTEPMFDAVIGNPPYVRYQDF